MWFRKAQQSKEPEREEPAAIVDSTHAGYEDSAKGDDSKARYQVGNFSVDSEDSEEYHGAAVDEENQRGEHNVFSDPEVAAYWRGIYEESRYENRHLFDPEMTWTKEEERKVVWKSDLRALLWAFIMFLALDIDRYNLKNSVSDNLLEDLGINEQDYNLGNTINLVCFLAAELPSQLVSKAVGADRFLPTQVVLWSLVATCQCKMNDRASFLVTRALVGFLEGGFLPEIITWMSYFYKHDEFITRSAWFYVANPLTQAFSGLLAAAIINLEGLNGWHGWQYVFLIEGLFTLTLGLLSYQMPAGPASTKAWYRPNGWYTDREEKIMANRILRDDPSKGNMNNRQGLSIRMFLRAIGDYDMWLLYITRMLADIITTPLSNYIPILLKQYLGFSSVKSNLLMVPYQFVSMFTMLGQSYLAKNVIGNGYALFFTPFWPAIPIACMRWWPGILAQNNSDTWSSYGLLFVALGYPPSWPTTISWSSQNSYSVSRRTVSAAIMNMFSQAGSIVGANIFQNNDKPKYPKGLETLFGISVSTAALVLIVRSYYRWRNAQRDKIWSRMTVEEQVEYLKTTEDEGNKRLDFRFAL